MGSQQIFLAEIEHFNQRIQSCCWWCPCQLVKRSSSEKIPTTGKKSRAIRRLTGRRGPVRDGPPNVDASSCLTRSLDVNSRDCRYPVTPAKSYSRQICRSAGGTVLRCRPPDNATPAAVPTKRWPSKKAAALCRTRPAATSTWHTPTQWRRDHGPEFES